VAKTLEPRTHRPHPDLLAAVVLHVLLASSPHPMTLEQVAGACERDPASPFDRAAIDKALRGLIADGLALRRGRSFVATRAALRADALRF
jgi:hypothetical protein